MTCSTHHRPNHRSHSHFRRYDLEPGQRKRTRRRERAEVVWCSCISRGGGAALHQLPAWARKQRLPPSRLVHFCPTSHLSSRRPQNGGRRLALPGNRAGHRPYRVPEPSCQREDQVTRTALQLPPSTCGRAPFAANRSGGREKRQRMTSQCTARRKALNSMHACGRMQGYLQQVTADPCGCMCGCAELVWIEGDRVFGQLREEGPQARARGPIRSQSYGACCVAHVVCCDMLLAA